MKLKPKSLILLSFSILFIFPAKNSFAQYPGMAQIRQSINKQLINDQINRASSMMTMMMGRMDSHKGVVNYKHTYEVILKDSTQKEVNSKIYTDTIVHKTYLVLVDRNFPKSDMAHREQKIYPYQTLSIACNVNESNPIYSKGLPSDSCWMFKTVSGAINAYSFLSEQDDDFNPSTIVGIQSQRGDIEHFNPDNLKKMLLIDNEAMEYFNKKDYYKALITYNNNVEKAARNKAKAEKKAAKKQSP